MLKRSVSYNSFLALHHLMSQLTAYPYFIITGGSVAALSIFIFSHGVSGRFSAKMLQPVTGTGVHTATPLQFMDD